MHVRFGSARRCRSNINYAGFDRGKAYVNFKITVYWVGDVIGCFVTSFGVDDRSFFAPTSPPTSRLPPSLETTVLYKD